MNFKLFRNRSGMTQEEVAKALGMPKKTYQNYEREVREPDSNVLCSLADLYDVTLDELVGRGCSSDDEQMQQQEEDYILDLYRSMSGKGRETLAAVAETLAELFPAEGETADD